MGWVLQLPALPTLLVFVDSRLHRQSTQESPQTQQTVNHHPHTRKHSARAVIFNPDAQETRQPSISDSISIHMMSTYFQLDGQTENQQESGALAEKTDVLCYKSPG